MDHPPADAVHCTLGLRLRSVRLCINARQPTVRALRSHETSYNRIYITRDCPARNRPLQLLCPSVCPSACLSILAKIAYVVVLFRLVNRPYHCSFIAQKTWAKFRQSYFLPEGVYYMQDILFFLIFFSQKYPGRQYFRAHCSMHICANICSEPNRKPTRALLAMRFCVAHSREQFCGSTSIPRPFDCLSKGIKVTLT